MPQLCLKSTKEHTGSGIDNLYDAICDQYARSNCLFAFALSAQVKKEFISLVEKFRRRYIDRDFKSLEILEIMRHTRNALYKDGQ